ncbi:hypothetical protein CDD83_5289 [Cordyceps sp. RAO-2017]|nr:hypothetical protein CDD83_5289 [Cordyceps sp. RAO-2017]
MPVHLKPSQRKAIAAVRAQAVVARPGSAQTLSHILQMSNISLSVLEELRGVIRQHAHIAIHFHPDRPVGDRLVAGALLEDGVYKNQFETGISNGLVSVVAGGPRDTWERNLFDDAFHDPSVSAAERPKYGALDITRNPDGPAPRFGSCFFVLKPEVSTRSTFTFGGSQSDPQYRGTIDEFDAILAAIFEESFTHDSMLGVHDLRPPQAVDLLSALATPRQWRTLRLSHNLDQMIEAQVHGEISLQRDVEALVIDPSFEKSPVGPALRAISKRFGIPLEMHGGLSINVDAVPADFRGPRMPSLAARISDTCLDAAAIGIAAQDLARHRQAWRDRGTYEEVLQELKLIWHVLVKYG